ncbi:dimethylsulfonioproprionate lyase family protein [Ruegeria marina]|uniref:Dimethylsulfoniopropionate lyase DddQ n=1 Tax=Ruegeria marina TaxID=639004 RepID=A0A1G6LN32_9RHOB|nr:dimethylsulfonioproprionate lyase family protein [Ruegeria marina]SDC44487.1 dimethylsulfoniopropionate lyase DddQ [Ruegeria marina]
MTLNHVLAAARALHAAHPDLAGFAPWPDDLEPVECIPVPVPATGLVAGFDLPGTPLTQPLIDAIRATVHLARWTRTYSEAEVGADFLNRYGYYELFGPTGHFHSTRLRGYVAYWGEGLTYDWHRHEAEEIYLVLAGGARFRSAEDSIETGPGQTRAHVSWQFHAMDTTDRPVLTFVLWRGAGMAGHARIDAA